MSDRSEKIVNLAREMLRDEQAIPAAFLKRGALDWKGIALTALLSATSAGTVVTLTLEATRPLHKTEKTEIAALVLYTAHLRGQPQDVVRQGLYAEFDITSLDDLSAHKVAAVRDWLHSQIRPKSGQ